MIENRDHVTDDLGAYALGALDAHDRSRVDVHLATCTACVARVTEYLAITGSLPLALAPVSPPPEGWTGIQAAIRRRGDRGRLVRVARWSIAAAAVVLLLWNVQLQRQVWHDAQGPQVEKLARRPGRLVILGGTTQPQASARLFAAVDGQGGHMAVSGLKPLPTGQVYQLWFLRREGAPASAATFTVDDGGRAWVVVKVPAPLEETTAIFVTEEPAPGSAAPTGPRVLEATQWR